MTYDAQPVRDLEAEYKKKLKSHVWWGITHAKDCEPCEGYREHMEGEMFTDEILRAFIRDRLSMPPKDNIPKEMVDKLAEAVLKLDAMTAERDALQSRVAGLERELEDEKGNTQSLEQELAETRAAHDGHRRTLADRLDEPMTLQQRMEAQMDEAARRDEQRVPTGPRVGPWGQRGRGFGRAFADGTGSRRWGDDDDHTPYGHQPLPNWQTGSPSRGGGVTMDEYQYERVPWPQGRRNTKYRGDYYGFQPRQGHIHPKRIDFKTGPRVPSRTMMREAEENRETRGPIGFGELPPIFEELRVTKPNILEHLLDVAATEHHPDGLAANMTVDVLYTHVKRVPPIMRHTLEQKVVQEYQGRPPWLRANWNYIVSRFERHREWVTGETETREEPTRTETASDDGMSFTTMEITEENIDAIRDETREITPPPPYPPPPPFHQLPKFELDAYDLWTDYLPSAEDPQVPGIRNVMYTEERRNALQGMLLLAEMMHMDDPRNDLRIAGDLLSTGTFELLQASTISSRPYIHLLDDEPSDEATVREQLLLHQYTGNERTWIQHWMNDYLNTDADNQDTTMENDEQVMY